MLIMWVLLDWIISRSEYDENSNSEIPLTSV
jgi:hypothetical protein